MISPNKNILTFYAKKINRNAVIKVIIIVAKKRENFVNLDIVLHAVLCLVFSRRSKCDIIV